MPERDGSEPVRIGSHLYGDGGIVDIFPVRPILDEEPDVVLGLNCYLPEGFADEPRASAQLT